MLAMAGIVFLFLSVYFLIDYIITGHRLKTNQKV
nr:MAG TPA: Honey bee toxin [Caudoviricetes sp.]